MNHLLFPLGELQFAAQHALAATEHEVPGGRHELYPEGPGLLWCKDEATYLLSNGLPRHGDGLLRVYAEGFGPLAAPDRLDSPASGHRQRDRLDRLYGPEPFCELLPLEGELLDFALVRRHGYTHLTLEATEDSITLGCATVLTGREQLA